MPYVLIGYTQVLIVFAAARLLFEVPMFGNFALLSAAIVLFIIATLGVGFLFSTIARSQMQSMQMTMFFFLPNILLSGFMFPFRGMPHWAQAIGEVLPLTHFLRIVRGVIDRAAGVVGRIVEKVLSDPKMLAIIAAPIPVSVLASILLSVSCFCCSFSSRLIVTGMCV